MRRSTSKAITRVRTATWTAAALVVASPAFADDVFWTGLGTDSQWFTASNWSPHLPGSGDNAFNQSSDAINFNNTISASVFSFADNGSLSILSGALQGSDPTSSIQVDGTFLIDGGTLANFHVLRSSPISFSTGASNVLSHINTDTDLQLQTGQQAHIQSGLTLGTAATATLSAGSFMYLDGSQSISGGTITNQGTISANTSGANVTLGPTTFSNSGTLQASSGAVLTLSSSLDNTNGTITIGDQSQFSINGITITRGNVNSTGTGSVIPTNNPNNSITTALVNANLNLSNGGRLRLASSYIANVQTSTLNNGAVLTAQGPGSIASGTITLGTTGTQQISVEASATLFLGASATIHGGNAILGVPLYTSGLSTIDNDGLISADVSGAAITISPNRFSNAGTVQAINGATVNVTPTGSDNTNSATYLASGAGSTMNFGGQILNTVNAPIKILDGARLNIINGVTVFYGNYTSSNSGTVSASSNSNNMLSSATLNAPIDLSNGGKLRLQGSNVSLNNSLIDNGAVLAIQENTTFASGTLQFGTTSGTQYLSGEGGSMLTINSGATIHGGNAIIGTNLYRTGTSSMSNHGLISADVSGAPITIQYNITTQATNPGTLQAINGGILNLNVGIYQLGASGNGTIHAGANSTVNFNGVNIGGGNLTGPGDLHFSNSFNNILNSVSVTNGTLDLTSPGRVQIGFGFSGSASLNNGATLAASTEPFSNGTITLGSAGTNALTIEGTSSLTLNSTFTVTGAGIIGSQALTAGANSLVNHGSISSSGGNLTIQPSSITSDGSVLASAGTKITLTNPSTFSGGIVGGNGAIVAQSSVSISNSLSKTGSGAVAFSTLPSFASGAALSLNQGALIFNYSGSSPSTIIRSWITAGSNGGSWNGVGIQSSAAADDPNQRTAIGYAEASQLGLANGGSFDGQAIPNQAVLVKYTYYGDNDLDGKVTLNDFSIFVDGFNGLGTGWVYGDYDYNGTIDVNDFSMFVDSYKNQGAQLSSLDVAIMSDPSLSLVQKNAMLSVVPEPSVIGLLLVSATAAVRRRRRA